MRDVEVNIPDGVSVSVNAKEVVVKGPKGEVKRLFKHRDLTIKVENNKVHVQSTDKAMINTVKKHILNLIHGVTEGFSKKMVVRYSHFPMKLKVQGNHLIIENFLGERKPRKARIMGSAKVTVKGNNVIIEGIDKEEVSQTAANIRQATKIRKKDIRVFQDGIYEVIE